MILIYDYFRVYRLVRAISDDTEKNMEIIFKKLKDLESSHNKAVTTYNAHMRALNPSSEE